jgi:endoglucanase
VLGVNLSGLEWAAHSFRSSASTVPSINYAPARPADVAYLAANGFKNLRLPITWEMLQPMLHDTQASAAVRAMVGEPGAFHAGYASYITGILDACAAAGAKCILDLHNYCRYRDFIFQADGSVIGLVSHPDPQAYAYTTDWQQVQTRIFALADGATLKQSNFTNFWSQAAARWKGHPGFGGYGLMNEPFNMPAPGSTVESSWGADDLTIWPAYAQAAINAIRAIDPTNPIYLGGNEWSSAMSLATKNPSWPLTGANIIYEVHMYLDAASSGQRFDYDTEVALGFSAGGSGPIHVDTGVERLKLAVDWAQPRGLKLALTETGMPTGDPRWEEMWKRMLNYARANNVDVYSWNGGSYWPLHNFPINHVPGWCQNRTLEPQCAAAMKASVGFEKAVLFDSGPGWAPSGTAVTITVQARGYLGAPVTLNVSSNAGGSFSKTTLTIPAGANGRDSFTFTSPSNAVATLTYTSSSAGLPPPPPRKIYSLSDPVGHAATSLSDAAMAIIAKYSACKWEMADGFTDYMQGAPAADGQRVRAIADSGYASNPDNAMEMLNWVNDTPSTGGMAPPVMRVVNGKKSTDHTAWPTWGFWCRKNVPVPETNPNPKERVPYDINDSHFVIAAVSVPGTWSGGMIFEASRADDRYASQLSIVGGRPRARCTDEQAHIVDLTSAATLTPNVPSVISFTSVPTAQRLRVNSSVVASGSTTYNARPFQQMLIGWSFLQYYPGDQFGGNIYSVITGKGAPTLQEMAVLERYLGSTAGITI